MPPLVAIAAAVCLSDPGLLLDANWRATVLSERPATTIASLYTVNDSGLSGSERGTVDFVTGWFAEASEVGPILGGAGFDGRESWSRDLTGFHSPQAGGNKKQLAINQAYRNANLWWHADRAGAHVESLGCDRVSVAPVAGTSFEAAFDPHSHLLVSVKEASTYGNRLEVRYSDFASKHGRMTPRKIAFVINDDPASTVTKHLRSSESVARRPATAYSMPSAQPTDWQIARAGRAAVPFRLLNNHIIVDVKVDGRGPFPFLLDSGGHEIITPSTMNKLALEIKGSGVAGGGGEKSATSGFAQVRRIDVEGATLIDPRVAVIDFSPTDVEGLELGGMLGVGFFERFIVQIDYAARTVTFMNHEAFTAADRATAGTPVPFVFYEHMPQVAGSFEGRPALLNIDTGSRSDISLTSPFVKRMELDTVYGKGMVVTDGWGAGGPVRSTVIRARNLALGSVEVCGPLAALSVATRGTFSDASFDGNIGSGLLKRFRVTFDYDARTLYLARLPHPEPDTGRGDRTGMWINQSNVGLEVMDVMPGGPAASAGIAKGDVITAIGGDPVQQRSLSDWRSMLKLMPLGHATQVDYLRSGSRRTTSLQPVDLVPELPAGGCS